MIRRFPRLFYLLFISAVSGGCLSTRSGTYESTVAKVETEGSAADKLELPTREKAKASLAAAQLLDKNGKNPEAVALYEQARNCNKEYNYVCRRLAVLYDRLGQYEKADLEYEKALALFPRDAALLNDVGYSHFVRANWVMAEDYLRQAVEVEPTLKRGWINLGMTLAMREQPQEALEAFKHAVPEAQAFCNLAFAFTLQGKFHEAMGCYRRALELAPDLERARVALAKLENPGTTQAAAAAENLNRSSMPSSEVEGFAAGRE